MKKNITKILLVGPLFAILLTGCGEKSNSVSNPTTRNKLVIRMFENMSKGAYQSTIAQAQKVAALDPANTYLPIIISRQGDNHVIDLTQQSLNKGDFNQAAQLIHKRKVAYPLNTTLQSRAEKVENINRINLAIIAYTQAKDLETRGIALANLERKIALDSSLGRLKNSVAEQRKILTQEIKAQELAKQKAEKKAIEKVNSSKTAEK